MAAKKSKKGKRRSGVGGSKTAAADRRAKFIEVYLSNGGNATAAYIAAGYSPTGANANAARLIAGDSIRAEIKRRQAEVLEEAQKKTGVTIEGVLTELRAVVHSDLRQAFDQSTGALLPPHLWPDDLAKAMASVKVVEMAGGMKIDMGESGGGVQHVPMYTKEVKVWDKNSGIEKAMKHLGLFEKDNIQKPATVLVISELDAAL